MTRVTAVDEAASSTAMDMEYRFSTTQNNDKITSQMGYVSGEEVTYVYDSLQRLITATTNDGFGNRLSTTVNKGSGPASSLSIDPATNRVTGTGISYDANGNLLTTLGQPSANVFDVENRLTASLGDYYAYNHENKRIWKQKPDGTQEVTFYGADGKRLMKWTVASGYLTAPVANVYFGAKLIVSQGTTVVADRLGSVRTGGKRYFPYGEEQTVTAGDQEKFTGYLRDQTTGFDYADQRYYQSTWGRFLTPDPFMGSANGLEPQSFTRYAYTQNDPVNYRDPTGLNLESDCFYRAEWWTCLASGGGGGFLETIARGGGFALEELSKTFYVTVCSSGPCPEGTNSSSDTGRPAVNLSATQWLEIWTPIRRTLFSEADEGTGGGGTNQSSSDGANSSRNHVVGATATITPFDLAVPGAAIGGAVAGPLGLGVGGFIGKMFGVGITVSTTISSNWQFGTFYVGPALTFTPLGTGVGFNAAALDFPVWQDPAGIMNGWSGSITYQPSLATGGTVVSSPGQTPVTGASFGTKAPVSFGVGYSIPLPQVPLMPILPWWLTP